MCGLLAIVDTPGHAGAAASHATDARERLDRLAHRGPDSAGWWIGRHAWLGHRRLAVVDPEGGAQPFVEDGLAWIANAEIYNHPRLRLDLGVRATSGSDCAVVGPAWRAFGDHLGDHLDGQFAAVCIDDDSGAWIALRDPVGIAPLYIGFHGDGSIWFASEMKALVDACARVELVPPGHAWVCDGRTVRRIKWHQRSWEVAPQHLRPSPKQIRSVLRSAVRKRFMCDVPFGVLLSGGLDSSLVASIAMDLVRSGEAGVRGPLHTFSIGLRGSPDLAAARRVASFLGTEHHQFEFTLDEALAAVPAVVDHLESYQQIRTGVPTYLLARRVRELGFKMVLSGEGADEILGGYLYFHKAPSPAEFHTETVRKLTRLHQYDVLRANKAPMAHGLELRFPFLDRSFIDLAMSIDPALRQPRPGPSGRIVEKLVLREAFACDDRAWLPDDILWRQKEQFSDGVGYGWVDHLRAHAAARIESAAGRACWDARALRFPEDPPTTPEMLWMRELFEERFVTGKAAARSPLETVGTGRSIACSTPEALSWDPAWESFSGDISGRAIAGVHDAADHATTPASGLAPVHTAEPRPEVA